MQTSLVSWARITQHKKHNGLEVKKVFYHGISLLARWVSNIINKVDSDWLHMFKAMLSSLTWHNSHLWKRLHYSTTDFMISIGRAPSNTVPTQKAYGRARPISYQLLQFSFDGASLIGHWSINDLLTIIPCYLDLPKACQQFILNTLHLLGIRQVKNLWGSTTTIWKNQDNQLNKLRVILDWAHLKLCSTLGTIHMASIVFVLPLGISPHQEWHSACTTLQKLSLSNSMAYSLLNQDITNFNNLNQYWKTTNTSQQWKAKQKNLWKSDLTQKAKTLLWRAINFGLYTDDKSKIFGHSNRDCDICSGQIETPNHIFLLCSFAQSTWSQILQHLFDIVARSSFTQATSLLQILDSYFPLSPTNSMKLTVFYKTTWYTWKEHNGSQYGGKIWSFSTPITLIKALHLLEGIKIVPHGKLEQQRLSAEIQGLSLPQSSSPRHSTSSITYKSFIQTYTKYIPQC